MSRQTNSEERCIIESPGIQFVMESRTVSSVDAEAMALAHSSHRLPHLAALA